MEGRDIFAETLLHAVGLTYALQVFRPEAVRVSLEISPLDRTGVCLACTLCAVCPQADYLTYIHDIIAL